MGGTACKKEHVLYCFDVLSAKLKGETIPRYEGEDKNEQLSVLFHHMCEVIHKMLTPRIVQPTLRYMEHY